MTYQADLKVEILKSGQGRVVIGAKPFKFIVLTHTPWFHYAVSLVHGNPDKHSLFSIEQDYESMDLEMSLKQTILHLGEDKRLNCNRIICFNVFYSSKELIFK